MFLHSIEFHGTFDDLAKIQAALPKLKAQAASDLRIDFYDSGTGVKTASVNRTGMDDVDPMFTPLKCAAHSHILQ